jgi:molybdopterin molybdotransferase
MFFANSTENQLFRSLLLREFYQPGIANYNPFMSFALPSYEEAAALVAARAQRLARNRPSTERLPLVSALGRVLAAPLAADRDQPPFHRSTRDGFACRAGEIASHRPLPIAGASRAGDPPGARLRRGAVWEIMTGAPVPVGADAVVMIEHVDAAGGSITLHSSRTLSSGDNIVHRASQARRGKQLLAAGTVLGSAQIALAASCGYPELEVYRRPRVAILATGDELVPLEAEPTPGKIRNSNGPMLAAMVQAAGGEPVLLPPAADTAKSLDKSIARAAAADLLILTGGVSAGKFDLVEPALERVGGKFQFTGVRIQPGKPTVFGERRLSPTKGKGTQRRREQCFFGLAGNPVSSAVTFTLFAAPVLAALAGRREFGPRFVLARLAAGKGGHGKPGLTRFLPARCTFGETPGSEPQVEFVPWEGSGDIAAWARANCFLVVPEPPQELEPGSMARILLF